MVTKWKKFSRNKLIKIFLFLIMIASLLVPYQMIYMFVESSNLRYTESYDLEPIIQKDYAKSSYHREELYYAILDIASSLNNQVLEAEGGIEYYILVCYGLRPDEEGYEEIYNEIKNDYEEMTLYRLEQVAAQSQNYSYYATAKTEDGTTVEDSNVGKGYFSELGNDVTVYTYSNGIMDHEMGNGIGEVLDQIPFDVLYAVEDVQIQLAFHEDYLGVKQQSWNTVRNDLMPIFGWAIAGIICFLISFIWLVTVTGKKPVDNEIHLCWIDKIFPEITFLIGVVAGGIGTAIVMQQISELNYYIAISYYSGFSIWIPVLLFTCGIIACEIVLFVCFLSIVRNIKNHSFIRKTIFFHIIRWIGRLFRKAGMFIRSLTNGKRFEKFAFQRAMFSRQLIFILSEMLMILLTFLGIFLPPLFVLPLIAGIAILAWYVNGYARINEQMGSVCQHIEQMADGDVTGKLILPEDSLLSETAQKLNDIGGGMQKSIEAQMRGERMKVDLVTNVSHDLKTPLTSIISYVDLLQKEDLSDEARDYVNILAQKSDRLKQIVSDLFDLAKSTSGNAQIDIEELDIKKLLEQTLGDMEDRILSSGKTIRLNLTEYPVPVMGDGGKLYRVFQNIIDNALKYSMDGTRIYIDMKVKDGEIYVSVKNIAAYEMDFTAEEILERFARGDRSRTTEGNGLGLSIAKSFTEVCGGRFYLEIDGDQFKCSVVFPIHRCSPMEPEQIDVKEESQTEDI